MLKFTDLLSSQSSKHLSLKRGLACTCTAISELHTRRYKLKTAWPRYQSELPTFWLITSVIIHVDMCCHHHMHMCCHHHMHICILIHGSAPALLYNLDLPVHHACKRQFWWEKCEHFYQISTYNWNKMDLKIWIKLKVEVYLHWFLIFTCPNVKWAHSKMWWFHQAGGIMDIDVCLSCILLSCIL